MATASCGDPAATSRKRFGPWAPPEGRGTGLVEMIRAIDAGVPERASGTLAAHVLDILLGIRDAAERGIPVGIDSTVDRIPPLPEQFDPTQPQAGLHP
jgi:hypothetical protein